MKRERRGERLQPEVAAGEVTLPYRGLRRPRCGAPACTSSPAPRSIDAGRAALRAAAGPGQEHASLLHGGLRVRGRARAAAHRLRRRRCATTRRAAPGAGGALQRWSRSNPLVNLWLDRSVADLAMLTTELPTGPYPFAGVPWYSTTFGRDGIITALECLWVDPRSRAACCASWPRTQATETDPQRDAEPGKILHEARQSEMARTRRDAVRPLLRHASTPRRCSWCWPAAYWRAHRRPRPASRVDLAQHRWRRCDWIDRYGDRDGDGFVEYARAQRATAWSSRAGRTRTTPCSTPTGRLAERADRAVRGAGLCLRRPSAAARAGRCARRRRAGRRARRSRREHLRAAFERRVLVRGDRHATRSRWTATSARAGCASSNAGHCCGAASRRRSTRPASSTRLLGDARSSAAGASARSRRARAALQPDVLPQRLGLAARQRADRRRAWRATAAREARCSCSTALFEASLHFDLHRLPELFCGFPRRAGAGPTLYPVACSPQAWAAAARVRHAAGLPGPGDGGARRSTICAAHAAAAGVHRLAAHRAGWARRAQTVDLLLQRYERSVGVEVLRKDASVSVTVVA